MNRDRRMTRSCRMSNCYWRSSPSDSHRNMKRLRIGDLVRAHDDGPSGALGIEGLSPPPVRYQTVPLGAVRTWRVARRHIIDDGVTKDVIPAPASTGMWRPGLPMTMASSVSQSSILREFAVRDDAVVRPQFTQSACLDEKLRLVCTENLNPNVLTMKSARVWAREFMTPDR